MGVEYGGLQSAEAMALARYFMYSQVYMHPVRRIYDIHLKDFLKATLPDGVFATDPATHLSQTDNEVLAAMHKAAYDSGAPGHVHARRIMCREHFKVVFEALLKVDEPGTAATLAEQLSNEFGAENVRLDRYRPTPASADFPVVHNDGTIASSLSESDTLLALPSAAFARVYVERSLEKSAKQFLKTIYTRKVH